MDRALLTRERKAARWGLLDALRPITTLKRVRECRRATLTGTGNPVLRTSPGGKAGYAGLATCGSPWCCPCCSGKIAGERASDLTAVMRAVNDVGGLVDFTTYTVRHHRGHRLRDVWDAVTLAWRAVTSGGEWFGDKQGMLGWARVVEITHTRRSGWHVHIHVAFAWKAGTSEEHGARVALRGWMRWDRALRRAGFDSTPVRGVKTIRVVGGDTGLAGYFAKMALELTSSWTKESTAGRTPFAILRDATETYRADDIELWREYEQVSHNRQQLTWSGAGMDLRKLAGLGREVSDEEAAAREVGGDDTIALVGDTWSRLSRDRRQAELLSVVDEGGVAAGTAWLDARGLAWCWAQPAQRRVRRVWVSPDTRRQARAVLDPLVGR